ncbi:MAG: MBL fold metallo-hydrolase [Patescibacteria group bacterium]|nr:MBL fold metallo-hydrolase [Patescibacteria group bacterium]
MTIFWLGHSAFKIQDKEVTVAVDPYGAGAKMPKFGAEILLITHAHLDHNNKEAIKGEPFLIDGPGEYEVKNVFVYGINSYHDNKQGAERGKNNIFLIEMEGIKVAHLGDFGQDSLTDEQLEMLEGVDVLLIPVGGNVTIDGEQAVKIISQLQPRIVIPMHYKEAGVFTKLEPVDKFLKEFGSTNPEKMDKLKINKREDLPQEETKVILLSKS